MSQSHGHGAPPGRGARREFAMPEPVQSLSAHGAGGVGGAAGHGPRDQHIHLHLGIDTTGMAEVLSLVRQLVAQGNATMAELEDLRVEIEATRSVASSAKALIEGLATRLEEEAEDPEMIRAMAAELRASREELAAAVTANTPAETVQGGEDTVAPAEPVPVEDTVPAPVEPAPAEPVPGNDTITDPNQI